MTRPTRRQVLVGLGLLLLAGTVASLTVGHDLYTGRRPDLGSFALVNFAGYLFFIVMPVEVLIPWYLAEGHAGHRLATLAVGTAIAAQAIDYGLGRLMSGHLVQHLIGERRLRRTQATIDRWGGWAIFVFSLLPLSSPTIVAAAGVVHYGLWRALTWSVTGLTVKYALMVLLFGPEAS
jgi:membrane protein DedA with SNARE-associated domain